MPREQFAPHFAAARAAGLHSVPHAGESTGPETIWDALTHLGAERIGHGIAAVRDPELHGVPRRARHPARGLPDVERLHPLGAQPRRAPAAARSSPPACPVTINSDDPPMFSTTLVDEYLVAADLLGLDEAGLAELARSAVHASFLDDRGKAALLAEIDDYVAPRH